MATRRGAAAARGARGAARGARGAAERVLEASGAAGRALEVGRRPEAEEARDANVDDAGED